MRYRQLLNFLSVLVGVIVAATGTLLLAIAASGNVRQGQTGLALGGAGLLLAAAPAIAMPFSARAAKGLLLLALAYLATSALRLTFWPQNGITPTPLVQGAVIAFAVLLVIRVFLGWRRKNAGLDT